MALPERDEESSLYADDEWHRRHDLRYAELMKALKGLRPKARKYVYGLACRDIYARTLSLTIAAGNRLAYDPRVVGKLAPEIQVWRDRVREMLAKGELPELHAELRSLSRTWDDAFEAKVFGWSLEELSADARRVLRTALRPPVNKLDLGIALQPGFPFSMFGASASAILELETWQRHMHKQELFYYQLGPRTQEMLNRHLMAEV